MNYWNVFLNASIFVVFSCYSTGTHYKEVMQSVIKKDPHLNVGVIVKSIEDEEILYEQHEDRLFTPASCIKLFTAAVALHILGAEFCFKTAIYTDGVISGDELFGNLFIKASGDPSLTTKNLKGLFKKIKEKGINRIVGNVYVDTAVFEDSSESYYGNGFCLDDIGKHYMQPISALIVDKNMKRVGRGKKIVLLNPHEYFCSMLGKLINNCGISYTKLVAQANTPRVVQELASHLSAPLPVLLSHMLKKSDNLYANAIFKYLGARQSGLRGTWDSGKEVVREFLRTELDIHQGVYVIEDGAGLSRYNLLSPAHIIKLLTWVYNNKKIFPIFCASLAHSGKDGTLRDRLVEYPGVVVAKTGTMHGISSLSGYICLDSHEPIIFSILLNGFIQKKQTDVCLNYKKDIEDTVCMNIIQLARCSNNVKGRLIAHI